MGNLEVLHKGSLASRIVAVLCAIVLAVSLTPIAPRTAQAATGSVTGAGVDLGAQDEPNADYDWASTTWAGGLDFSWYDASDVKAEYHITTPAQWEALAWICSEHLRELATLGADSYTKGNIVATKGDIPTAQNTFTGVKFYLDNDIDMGGVKAADGTWSGWNYYPIGSQGVNDQGTANWYGSFYGSFDGRGHVVKNVYANRGSGQSYQSVGLFGRVGAADDATPYPDCNITIKNVAVSGSIAGGRSVGGIVGKTLHVANGKSISIENCVNLATVTSTDKKGLGGVVGALWNVATLSNCANLGTVTGSGSPKGAIAGTDDGNEGIIKNVYSTQADLTLVGEKNPAINGYVMGTDKTSDEMKAAAFVETICGEQAGSWVAYDEASSLGALMKELGVDGYPMPASFAPADTSVVDGGSVIDVDGTYTLAENATGLITVNAGVKATVQGASFADGVYQDKVYSGLAFDVEEGGSLTLENVYISTKNATDKPIVNYQGGGAFNIEGTNIIDLDSNNCCYSAIHVGGGIQNTVVFGGSGVLYGYKNALGAFIGANSTGGAIADDPMGNVVFESGTWNLKGTKVGAVVGNDMAQSGMGAITVNGGELHLKAVARGACLGGSASGYAADVTIAGGLVECYCDWDGSAVGGAVAGKGAASPGFGALTVTGGSLKTVLSSNVLHSAYGFTDEEWTAALGDGHVLVTPKAITAANDTALLEFDMSKYATSASVDVKVDGEAFYAGAPCYSYLVNEVKNPTGPDGRTSDNFLANTVASAFPEGTEWSGGYPNNNGSSFAPDSNLYLYLSKADHEITVGDDTYVAKWDAEADQFAIGTSLDGATVTAEDQIYTGSELTPAPKVTLGNQVLNPETDYTVSYRDNMNAGTATIVITGKGNYFGEATGTFTIAAASLAKASVTAAKQTYTGKKLTPAPTVKLNGKTLKQGTDYTVAYSNNVNAGKKAVVKVTGKGNYTGTATGNFTIVAANNSLVVKTKAASVAAAKVAKKAQVVAPITKATAQFGKPTFVKTQTAKARKLNGYKNNTLTVNKKTGKVTVKKGTKAGSYKLMVTAKVAKTANYKAANKSFTVTVKVTK